MTGIPETVFVLVVTDGASNDDIHSVYSSEQDAEHEGRRLAALYKQTNPQFEAWAKKRWNIVTRMRSEGRALSDFGNPTDEQEAEIVSLIGPAPRLEGVAEFYVADAPFRLQP